MHDSLLTASLQLNLSFDVITSAVCMWMDGIGVVTAVGTFMNINTNIVDWETWKKLIVKCFLNIKHPQCFILP